MRHIFELKSIVHNLIILELTLKTLEYDKVRLTGLKMAPVMEEWYEEKAQEVFSDIVKVKKDLSKDGCKIDSSTNDGMFTEYSVLVRGEIHRYTYSNVALRNWCMEEMKRLLGMPYRTPDDMR
ncbi:hypothetical protein [Lysinibacillus odysseyi]|uniref:Uncharacterized protein n=1 Tax=Lysinibacillus odysseyi 34hs-1 = NBRC 100172 TaxID=1220589 RepID=A0A0A3J1V9_9BACI|nr:hypothetical protein [Lysinibacillus odysseyi]KGR89163.1 hypothetical protein CD32_00665 [Lysinibacillus odysseyi 34hs-1 = NBRC 100172]